MNPITLQDLAQRIPSKEIVDEIDRTMRLSPWNRAVDRRRMNNNEVDSCVWDMTRDGNDPMPNERMLDFAACYFAAGVYTDSEWEQYFLPAINEQIARNDAFVRWKPGYLIREKETGRLSVVEYDYALAFGGHDYTSLSLCNLDADGNPSMSWAWARYGDYELVDKDHTAENISKVAAYLQGNGSHVPYCLNQALAHTFYGKPSTDPPMRNL